jgi:hypothetical protein
MAELSSKKHLSWLYSRMFRSDDKASVNQRVNTLRHRVHPGSSDKRAKAKTARDFTLHDLSVFISIMGVSCSRT